MQYHLEFKSIIEPRSWIKAWKMVFIANIAHHDETEGSLIWPQLKLCSHKTIINRKARKMTIALSQS